jgi:hypothetical protein
MTAPEINPLNAGYPDNAVKFATGAIVVALQALGLRVKPASDRRLLVSNWDIERWITVSPIAEAAESATPPANDDTALLFGGILAAIHDYPSLAVRPIMDAGGYLNELVVTHRGTEYRVRIEPA